MSETEIKLTENGDPFWIGSKRYRKIGRVTPKQSGERDGESFPSLVDLDRLIDLCGVPRDRLFLTGNRYEIQVYERMN